jgi:hypothetical protein
LKKETKVLDHLSPLYTSRQFQSDDPLVVWLGCRDA